MLAAIFALACSGVPVLDTPPLHIAVSFSASISPTLVQQTIMEADAVWRDTGIRFIWRRADHDHLPADLYVMVSDTPRPSLRRLLVLGWITVNEDHRLTPYIRLSYANAVGVLDESREQLLGRHNMPVVTREMYLGRAMGRALAHELGHYLLGSNAHARTGLMSASLEPETLFAPGRAKLYMPTSICEALAHKFEQR